ncbi:MAG: hypothetical protein ACPGJV_01915 [Bacteriovoracaceae bacterium]
MFHRIKTIYLSLMMVLFLISDFSFAKGRDTSFAPYKPNAKDSFVSTLLGFCKRPNKSLFGLAKIETKKFNDKELQKPVQVKYALHSKVEKPKSRLRNLQQKLNEKKTYTPLKSPLVFVFPGSFGSVSGIDSTRFIHDYIQLGHHVVTFPSPLHPSFVSLKASYKPGDFVNEAKTFYRLMQKIISDLESRNLVDRNNIRLSGLSYGAFLATIITALDGEQLKLLTGETTLISPPADYGKSVEILDQYILEVAEKSSEQGFFGIIGDYFKVCSNEASQEELQFNAKALSVYHSFQKNLVKMTDKYLKTHDLPVKSQGKSKWQKEFTFKNYFDLYAPELWGFYTSELATLKYWVDRAQKESNNILIISAKDDWLNESDAWDLYPEEQLLLVEHGGHYGFRNTSWFASVLKGIFSLPKKVAGTIFE